MYRIPIPSDISIVITLLGKSWVFSFFLVCGLCTFYHGWFALPLGVIGRLCSVTVALPGLLLGHFTLFDYFTMEFYDTRTCDRF